jgi:glyoxylase-like metal-dependent hydrolase (beta-lactamase superfamily II)|tara:strand:- start:11529 stop:12464 length:936 start_codon:yes stop_codon:yes gene_type:complete
MEKNIRQLDEIIWQLDLKVNNDKEFIAPYLIKADEGYIIVDVGPTCGIPELERQLKVLGVNKNNLKYVFLTHIHLDHSGGLGTLLRNFPDTKVVVHRRGAPHLIDPEKVLWQSSVDTLGWVAEMYEKPEPVKEECIVPLNDKTFEIKVNNLEFSWVETPGHASHHFSFMLENKKIMFCGDAVGMYINSLNILVPTTPLPYRMDSGIASIKQMMELKPDHLAFAHHAMRESAMSLMEQHIEQLEVWKDSVASSLSQGIEDEESIAKELSKVDYGAGKLFSQEQHPGEYGGLRRALVSSITGFKHLVETENKS